MTTLPAMIHRFYALGYAQPRIDWLYERARIRAIHLRWRAEVTACTREISYLQSGRRKADANREAYFARDRVLRECAAVMAIYKDALGPLAQRSKG